MNLRYELSKLKGVFFFSDFVHDLSKGKIIPPYYVLWDCTRRCNLNCAHCGATKEKYARELSTVDIMGLVDQLAAFKVNFFAATGGEPLMRKDLLEIMAYASGKGIGTGFATNGFFIDKATAKRIKEAGIYSVQVSLDGTEEIHNGIRGNNESFRRATDAIRFLKDEKVELVTAATTVTPMNLSVIGGLKDVLVGLGVKEWRICLVMPIGRAEKKKLMLSPMELRQLFDFIYSNRKAITIRIGENLPYLAEYEKKVRDSPNTCPVGFTACCIGVDGNVRGCPEMPDKEKNREGNILEKPFHEIWTKGFKRYRERESIKTDLKCAKCKNKEDCYGGCWVMREGGTQCIFDLLG